MIFFFFSPPSQWSVHASCAVSGSGLVEGLDWLSDRILERSK